MDARRDVFQAISDPTRRQIINLIAHKSLNLNSIADNFDISRPAISQHMKILAECGLLVFRKQGRERYVEATLEPLTEVGNWVDENRKLWAGRLNSLERLLGRMQEPVAKTSKTVRRKRK